MMRRTDGSLDPAEIIASLDDRRLKRGPVLNKMVEVARTYGGDVAIPLPEMDASEHSFVGNLLNQGVDAMGQRIGSVGPDVDFMALSSAKVQQNRARDRRSVVLSWWDANSMVSKLRRRARHYVGHGLTSVVLRPDVKRQAPMWMLRNPMDTFPAEVVNDDDIMPSDTIYSYDRTYQWLRSNYPQAAGEFWFKGILPTSKVEVVEYVDCHGTLLFARSAPTPNFGGTYTRKLTILERAEYDYGDLSPSIVLGRITLGGKVMGQFDQMVPMYRMQAKLAALEIIAIQRGIFPDVWFVGSNNQEPTIVREADGVGGRPGLVTDVSSMQVPNVQPTYLASQAVDRLEYAQRMTARIPAEFGGVGATNVRTGRRGDSILSQTVDFPIQEAQDDLARSLELENRVAIAMQKAHWGRKSFSFYVSGNKMKGRGEYVPKELFDTDDHTVNYPNSGSDVNTLSIAIMQLTGAGLMSQETARKKHPFIEDPEAEKDRIVVEGLMMAALSGIQTRVASPDPAQAMPIGDVVRLIELIGTNKKELPEAWHKVQQEAQERQAEQAPQGAPETMPGAETAGAGAEMGVIPEPSGDTRDLAGLFNALRQPREPQPAGGPA